MIDNAELRSIISTMLDPALVVEVYPSDTVPTEDGFDPNDALVSNGALACFASIENLSFYGASYRKLVRKFGNVKRTISAETNNATIDFDNLERQLSDFEFEHGFEGLILVVRLLSRSQSVELSDTLILFVGQCDKPKSGTKAHLSVTAQFILGALETEMPRRKYSPEDQEGRVPSDLLFEGFPFTPQDGVGTYGVRVRRGGFWSLFGIKKAGTKNLNWSSFSDIDVDRDVAEVFGRVQMAGTHLGYADVSTQIRMLTAFCEGEIEGFLNARSVDSNFPLDTMSYHESLGELGGVGQQTIDLAWVAPGYYSRTAHLRCQANNSAADETDPAPEVVAVILGRLLLTPDGDGDWEVLQWSDNPAAVTYFALTSPDYYKLDDNWIHKDSFTTAHNFNDEILFDTSFSDFLFVPDTAGFAELAEDGNNYLKPTSSITTKYFKFKSGDMTALEALSSPATDSRYEELEERPIEPPDPEDPDTPTGYASGLAYYLRRRYTCNVAITEKMKAIDFLHKVVFPASRMFFSQASNGQIKLNHKKPVDWALGAEELTGDSIDVDDVSAWIDNLSGHLLIDPHTNQSEVRDVTGAAYSPDQNSVSLTASDNITVTHFDNGDGADVPAYGTLLVDDPMNDTDPSNFVLDGIEIEFTAGEDDTVETIASFIYASINAHPVLSRRFRATVLDDEVTIYAKFGTLELDSDLTETHVAPLANPVDEPTLTATASGSLPAGVYSVAFSYENEHGQTLLSPFAEVTLTANQKITVTTETLPAGADSIAWYVVPVAGSSKLRFHSRNDGSGFVIDSLPFLDDALPPDLNRTGTEVLRVSAVFSDRAEERSNVTSSNVIQASFEWLLGNREKAINRVDLKYRDATQDFRLIELRLKDRAHIAKVKKVSNMEVNGSGIDNYHQAYRITSGLLAEHRDADFFYKWSATREALLLEEGDVVAITDSGSGFYNLPVRIEDLLFDLSKAMPKANFTARKYSTTLYDDLVAERVIPTVVESET